MSRLPEIIRSYQSEILTDWMRQQLAVMASGSAVVKESDLRELSRAFLDSVRDALQKGGSGDTSGPMWAPVRDFIADLARTRARAGATPSETAWFIFSMKLPIFSRLRQEYGSDAAGLAADVWTTTELFDRLGLLATDGYLKTREEVIVRQQQELLELSTPVVKLWEGILALPLIGTLDSARTQVVMENLLQQIVQTGASIAIIDITGVPTVDTLVAQHLLKTVAAARLMGADCIISGVRPQIALTIVHLGVELGDIATRATLADAFRLALARTGQTGTIATARATRAD
jgi:rsbT co-antagonist protein RsbR